MLLTNITDYMLTGDSEIDLALGFHIPNHKQYKELGFPYRYTIDANSNLTVIDSWGNLAVFTENLINSTEWEVFEPPKEPPK